MANKKAEIKSKKRTLYLHEDLFDRFSDILKKNGKNPSKVFNQYMTKIVEKYNEKKDQASKNSV